MMARKKDRSRVSTRDKAIGALSRLPDDATFEDALYALNVVSKIERGLMQAAAGQTIPHVEVKARLKSRIEEIAKGQVLPSFQPPSVDNPAEITMPKDEVLRSLSSLFVDVNIDEAIDRLYFLSRIARARAEIAAGQTFTQEEVRARTPPWLP